MYASTNDERRKMFSPEKSVLLIIDVQEKLTALMREKDGLLKNIRILIQAARSFRIPILWTEQAPRKIGTTVLPVSSLLTGHAPIPKVSFSCLGEKRFCKALSRLRRREVILAGIETHVCVYQTAADLLKSRYRVQVVSDAVSSRTAENKHIGLERMKSLGCAVTSTEMVLFELLKTTEHAQFKRVLDLIR